MTGRGATPLAASASRMALKYQSRCLLPAAAGVACSRRIGSLLGEEWPHTRADARKLKSAARRCCPGAAIVRDSSRHREYCSMQAACLPSHQRTFFRCCASFSTCRSSGDSAGVTSPPPALSRPLPGWSVAEPRSREDAPAGSKVSFQICRHAVCAQWSVNAERRSCLLGSNAFRVLLIARLLLCALQVPRVHGRVADFD